MAGSIVQSRTPVTDDFTSATTIADTITGVVSGNHIVAQVGWDDSGGTITATVSDGTSYASAVGPIRDTVDNHSGQVFYLENAGSGSHTVTATFSATTGGRRIKLYEVSGLATAGSLDKSTGQFQNGPGTGTDAVHSGDSAATTNANDFVMGFTEDSGEGTPGTGTITQGTGYTVAANNTVILAGESKNVSATGTQRATFTESVNQLRITMVAAFKQAAAGGPAVVLMGQIVC